MESSTFLSGSTAHINRLSQTTEKPSKEQITSFLSTGRNTESSSGRKKRIRDFTETRSTGKVKIIKSDELLSFLNKLKTIEDNISNNNFLNFEYFPTNEIQYFNKTETLRAIQQLSQREQTLLANKFFHSKSIKKTFDTISGRYLATLPTTDQYLVGVIGSIMESCLEEKKGTDDYSIYIWENVEAFRINNSVHLPKIFVNSIHRKAMDSDTGLFFGFDSISNKATRHTSSRCELCFTHQTDQEEHNKVFHPNSFVSLGTDDKNSRLVYSDELVKRLEDAHYSAHDKKRLLPSVLLQTSGQVVLDCAALSTSAKILPEVFLSKTLCQFIELMCKHSIVNFQKSIILLPSEKYKAMKKCFIAMVEFSTNIPVLARIGLELRALLNKNNTPVPEDSVADRYIVKTFARNAPLKKIDKIVFDFSENLLAMNAIQRIKVHPYLAGKRTGHGDYFFSRKESRGILRQAMDNVSAASGSDVRPGSAPVFIGFIPPTIAKGIAGKHGFLDSSNWCGNFFHGKYSHALALTCLTHLVGLNQEMLKTLVEEKHEGVSSLWSEILDSNPYLETGESVTTNALPFLIVNSSSAISSIYRSPFNYHELLTSGRLSVSLNEIKEVIVLYSPEQQTEMLKKLAEKMGIEEPFTLDSLTEISDNISVLEKVLATKHLHSMEQVIKSTSGSEPIAGSELFDPATIDNIGNFPDTDGKAERLKASRYLDKGYTVLGISSSEDNDDLHEITRESDINQYDAFIAYPPVDLADSLSSS